MEKMFVCVCVWVCVKTFLTYAQDFAELQQEY